MVKWPRFSTSPARTELHQAMARLQHSLVADKAKGYELRVANRLWGQKGYEFLPDFLQTTRQQYGAELGVLDFAETHGSRPAGDQHVG